MFFAVDKDGKRVYIDNAYEKFDYFCPQCGEKLVLKKGEIMTHHFAHPKGSVCCDSWHYDSMTLWHRNMQNLFPLSMQEVVVEVNGVKHIADVLIPELKLVIEFQHSHISPEEFEERNRFYNAAGYKVIWLFDFSEAYYKEAIAEYKSVFKWTHPKDTFNNFEINSNVQLYFLIVMDANDNQKLQDYYEERRRTGIDDLSYELDEYDEQHRDDEATIIKVTWVCDNGFEYFGTNKKYYTTKGFLTDIGYLKKTIKQSYSKNELYDKLESIYQKDHSTYFYGCPLSSTHKCVNSTIDVPESKYDQIRPCINCEYSKYLNGEYYCNQRFANLKLDENDLITNITKNKRGRITSITIRNANGEKNISIEDVTVKGDTIIDLWENLSFEPKFAIFKNLETGMFVKILKNPINQFKMYKSCKGYISSDSSDFNGKFMEIYYVNKPIWVLYKTW